ncbi:DUF742 domain-containing protein [Streptomyces sp. NPDC059373]
MAAFEQGAWSDEDEQDVRPYSITGGRTRPRHTMRLVSLLAAGRTPPPGGLGPEAEQAFALCRRERRSVAEIAATLQQPVQVTKIVLSDLIDSGALIIAVPDTVSDPADNPQLLEAVLAGLRHKFPDAA